eukprot:8771712-Pyramimonas_sp.AAC.1
MALRCASHSGRKTTEDWPTLPSIADSIASTPTASPNSQAISKVKARNPTAGLPSLSLRTSFGHVHYLF